jgi:methyl-accepting chemotaxis protein
MDLAYAVRAHVEWRIKFRTAISKQEPMDIAAIAADDRCPLGKWLHGEGKREFGKLIAHSVCVQKHAAFHVEAGKVAQAIDSKKYAEAEAMLALETPYQAASLAVSVAINELRNATGL